MPRVRHSLQLLALAGVVGPLLFWLVVFLLGALTPDYSHMSDFISTLGAVGAPYADVQRVNFVVLGLAIGAVALKLHRWFDDRRRPSLGTMLLALFGLGIIGAGVFPSHPADPGSTTELLHNAASGVGLFAGLLGIALTSRRLHRVDRWPQRLFGAPGTVATLILTAGLFAYSIDTAWVGLGQRLFVGTLTLWVAYVSTRLLRRGRPRSRDSLV